MEIERYRNADLVVLFSDCHNFSRIMVELGDRGTLAFFDPEHDEAAAAHAVEAGRRMRTGYAALAKDSRIATETELGVGIALGPCELGMVGHESLRTFDIFGDCVNQAAVIGHHRGIAITAAVREALGPDVEVHELPEFRAKWMTEPIAIFEVARA